MRKSKASDDSAKCEVSDCSEQSKRSISYKKVHNALPTLKFEKTVKKVHVCQKHYKEYKKATKQERKLETLTWH